MRLPIRVMVVLVAIGLLVPAGALAHRAATKTERSQILSAVVRQHELSRPQANCQAVTVSTVNSAYASVTWPAKLSKACMRIAANGVIIERRQAGQWKAVAVGSSLSCPIKGVPTTVARDLGVCH